MSSKPLVSIIMPAYNSEQYIAASIESVVNQTYTNWELIIVDDGSTDSTSLIIKKYKEKDNRIHYLYQENARQARARNLGIKASKGEFIAFLDSDDLWLEEKLEISIKEFWSADQDILFTNAYIIYNDSSISDISSLRDMNICAGIYKGDEGLSLFIEKNRIPILTVLATRQAINEVNNFNDTSNGIAEDYELWLNLLAKGKTIRSVDLKLSIYRIHEQSTTSNNNMSLNVIKMFLRFFDQYPDLRVKNKNQIVDWFIKAVKEETQRNKINTVFNKNILEQFSIRINPLRILYLKVRGKLLTFYNYKNLLVNELEKQKN